MGLCDLTAHELIALLHSRKVSASEIMDSVIQRIELIEGDVFLQPRRTNGEDDDFLHAFITLQPDKARENARQVDDLLMRGESVGALAGIPLAVKDIFCAKNTFTTAGSRTLANYIAPYDATAVSRLKSAGAILIGKTQTDEFAFGSSTETSYFQPTTTNPWNANTVPGGSSGGSSAAVAMGEAIIAIGSDTSGSIRQPAALCGVVGVKPTYGRISRYGLIAFASSLDCVGPITKDVQDAALMTDIMGGSDSHDSTTLRDQFTGRNLCQNALGKSIRGMNLGVLSDSFLKDSLGCHNDVLDAFHVVQQVYRDAGANLQEIDLPHVEYAIPCYFVISRAEASSNLHRYDGVKYGHRLSQGINSYADMLRMSRRDSFGKQPILRVMMGMFMLTGGEGNPNRYYHLALQVRDLIRQDFVDAFKKVSGILAPTTPTVAFLLNRRLKLLRPDAQDLYESSAEMQYADILTVPADHAGIPAISLPCGFSPTYKLPIGFQVMTPWQEEPLMFQIASAYEQATSNDLWRKLTPFTDRQNTLIELPLQKVKSSGQPSIEISSSRFDDIAHWAEITIESEADKLQLRRELNKQLEYIDKLEQANIPDNTQMMSHGNISTLEPFFLPLREDVVSPSEDVDLILSNRPGSPNNSQYFVVPSISHQARPVTVAKTDVSQYYLTIGLETHIELSTNSKIFCSCGCVGSGDTAPNTVICPVCTGQPGTLPVLNKRVLQFALKLAKACGSRIAVGKTSYFYRKNYFYPDLPKGYQISQFNNDAVAIGGQIILPSGKVVRLRRIQIEEDAGKIEAGDSEWLIDMNRCGVPLIEIVSEPDLQSADDAIEYMKELRRIVRYLKISDANMHKGNLRCDANVSVQQIGELLPPEQVIATEIKNLNSFDYLRDAINLEFHRQSSILMSGGKIDKETLRYDEHLKHLQQMRKKEFEVGYRYFKDPDLPVIPIDDLMLAEIDETFPELPSAKRKRFINDYELSIEDAFDLTNEISDADYFETCVKMYDGKAKLIANWIRHQARGILREAKKETLYPDVTPEKFVGLILLIDNGSISDNTAKTVLAEMIATGNPASIIVAEKQLQQMSDPDQVGIMVNQVLLDDPQTVQEYIQGKESVLNYLIGRVMKLTQGKVKPQVVREIMIKRLHEVSS
jgi:aspartyl-tRNA(Asn)/glutamyl-tRNA(Gln) amidotransferase subunit A